METPRRKADVAMIGAVVAILLQFGGLVWGAAKLSSAVEQLREVTQRLEVADARRNDIIADQSGRIRVLEVGRMEILRRLEALEEYHRGR